MNTVRMRRFATLVLVTALWAGVAPVALADTDDGPVVEEPSVQELVSDDPAPKPAPRRPPRRVRRVKVTRDIVFPIVGATQTFNGFGDCRDNCTREHYGNDILTYGWKGVPVVASHDGVITEIRDDGEWCNAVVTGDDGWYTRYIHMNNDTPGYDDEDYACVPPGLTVGDRVKAGQLIGWVGDSGNAEDSQPHIHFEIRMPSGLPVDPYASLKSARRINARQVGSGDPAATMAQIAMNAYPYGAPTVTVMAIDDYIAVLDGGYAPFELDGPLLLSDWENIPAVTLEALVALAPARVEIMGDLWLPDVLDQLDGKSALYGRSMLERAVENELDTRIRVVETSEPLGEQPDGPADGIVSITSVDVPAPDPASAPFSLVVLGDRDEIAEDVVIAFSYLTARVATTMMDFVEPENPVGNGAFEGIGSSGSRYTLYYPDGENWASYPAKEAPDETPGFGYFVVEPGSLTMDTVTFLISIVDAPIMPFWR